MIIAHTSIWIDHFRAANSRLGGVMEQDRLLIHPFVVGEIALGSIGQRQAVIRMLRGQRQAPIAMHHEVVELIERGPLHGSGIGYVDAHLLAAARLAGAGLWTRDRRLNAVAERLGIAFADMR